MNCSWISPPRRRALWLDTPVAHWLHRHTWTGLETSLPTWRIWVRVRSPPRRLLYRRHWSAAACRSPLLLPASSLPPSSCNAAESPAHWERSGHSRVGGHCRGRGSPEKSKIERQPGERARSQPRAALYPGRHRGEAQRHKADLIGRIGRNRIGRIPKPSRGSGADGRACAISPRTLRFRENSRHQNAGGRDVGRNPSFRRILASP